MKKDKYCYDDKPDKSRPFVRLEPTRMQYGTAKISPSPTFMYLDLDDETEVDEHISESSSDTQYQSEPSKPRISKGLLALRPEDYDKNAGILQLAPFKYVVIARLGKAKKKNGKKTTECWLLECVFKSVNTQKSGVTFSKVLGVNTALIGKTEKRKVINAVDAINKKVTEADGPEKLIKIQEGKIFVNTSYL